MSFAHKVVLWVVQRRWLDLMNTPLSLSGKVQSERVQKKTISGVIWREVMRERHAKSRRRNS